MKHISIRCIFLFLLFTALNACSDDFTSLDPVEPDPISAPELETPDWYTLYFSDLESPSAFGFRGGPDAALADAIEGARASVEAAIYDLDLWSIRDALLDAHRRGVNVRLVVEENNLDRPEIAELIEAGIPTLVDQNYALMHHKFVVIDRFEVWTGSMNFTRNGAYLNNNNLIRISSSRLAEDFLVEFEEMFSLERFGASSRRDTPNPNLTINGTPIEVYFSPDDGTAERIIELITNAKISVYFLAFSFTSDPIADALIAAETRGVEVSGVFETSQASGQGGEFFRLADLGMGVELDGNPRKMHHKVIIIDSRTVITGSYNFSRSAEESNDENTLIIHNREIANQFLVEFEEIFLDVQ